MMMSVDHQQPYRIYLACQSCQHDTRYFAMSVGSRQVHVQTLLE